MKGLLIGVLALVGISVAGVCVVGSWAISSNNSIVAMNESAKSQWSQVENVYQRRSDLIPNLVNTVKGYAKHEAEVLEEVTKARASVGQVKVNASNAQDIVNYEKAQSGLTQALSRLMVVSEQYPDLKADKNFMELQSQLEGTENRIAVERKKFNESARDYNQYIQQFPAQFIASYRGFKPMPYFEAEATANTAPKVQF